jgi:hypothetical protein
MNKPISAADLRAYIAAHWPAYCLISRKECNHAARLVERRTGITRLKAGSNGDLRAALDSPAHQAGLRKPDTGFGLEAASFPEVRRAELEKLQRTINECMVEAREWTSPEDALVLTPDTRGRYAMVVNGVPIEHTEAR